MGTMCTHLLLAHQKTPVPTSTPRPILQEKESKGNWMVGSRATQEIHKMSLGTSWVQKVKCAPDDRSPLRWNISEGLKTN